MFITRPTLNVRFLWSLVLAMSITSVKAAPSEARLCNGRAELCARKYGNITFMGAHDSFAISKNPLALARNQRIELSEQLDSGVRLLQAQAHMEDEELHFCHTSCKLFDGGGVKDYLNNVKNWLDKNTNEVITFVFTNPNKLSMTNVWAPIFRETGMDKLSYVPKSQPVKRDDWPTLGELIDSGKRVVTFIDNEADKEGDKVDYLLPEFTHIWETPFNALDDSFPCSVNRTKGPLSNEEHMHMINHFLDVNITGILLPHRLKAEETNSVASILKDAEGCQKFAAGKNPNFVLMDFVHKGDWKKAGEMMNGF